MNKNNLMEQDLITLKDFVSQAHFTYLELQGDKSLAQYREQLPAIHHYYNEAVETWGKHNVDKILGRLL